MFLAGIDPTGKLVAAIKLVRSIAIQSEIAWAVNHEKACSIELQQSMKLVLFAFQQCEIVRVSK